LRETREVVAEVLEDATEWRIAGMLWDGKGRSCETPGPTLLRNDV
jgi:hypothetical protein